MSVLIVFDWDDTLFPTTSSLSDPKLRPLFHKKRGGQQLSGSHKIQLRALQAAATNAIKVASQFGRVAIVTLAEEAWVQHACGMLMPALLRLIHETDLQVVSAQDFCTATCEDAGGSQEEGFLCGNGEVKNLKPLIEAKAAAMRSCISEGSILAQIVSVGDSEVEAHAARQVGMERNGTHQCLHKVLKLCEMPTVEALTAELNTVAWWLPQVFEHPQSIFADIRNLNLKVGPCPTRKVRTPSTQRQQEENKENEQRKDWMARPIGVNVRNAAVAVPVPPNRLAGPRPNVVSQPRKRSPNPASKLGGGRKGGCESGHSSSSVLCEQSANQASVAVIATSPIQRLPSIKLRNQ